MLSRLAFAYDLETYLPMAEGNVWHYGQIGEEETSEVRIEGKEMVLDKEALKRAGENNEYELIALNPEGLKLFKDFNGEELRVYNPPMLLIPADLQVGEKRQYTIQATKFELGGDTGTDKTISKAITLEAIETVEVPAGKFDDCINFAIVTSSKEPQGDSETSDCNIWLAPGVGIVKEFCLYSDYNPENEEVDSSMEMSVLVSAVIDGKKIED